LELKARMKSLEADVAAAELELSAETVVWNKFVAIFTFIPSL